MYLKMSGRIKLKHYFEALVLNSVLSNCKAVAVSMPLARSRAGPSPVSANPHQQPAPEETQVACSADQQIKGDTTHFFALISLVVQQLSTVTISVQPFAI